MKPTPHRDGSALVPTGSALRVLPDRREQTTRWLRVVLPIAIGFELLLGFLYLWGLAEGRPFAMLDFNGRQTLPSLLQAGHLAALAAICGWRLYRSTSSTVPSRLLLRLFVFTMTFAAADELFKIHLMSHSETVRHAFVGVYFGAIVALPVLFLRDLKAVWRLDRGSLLLGAAGLGVVCVGVFGSEWIRDLAIGPLWGLLGD